jgi:hypothetical protein
MSVTYGVGQKIGAVTLTDPDRQRSIKGRLQRGN